jgi:hypothetical protein
MSTTYGDALTWPGDLRIPAPPSTARRPAIVRPAQPRPPAWREAMAAALVGLVTSWLAGEALLLLSGL